MQIVIDISEETYQLFTKEPFYVDWFGKFRSPSPKEELQKALQESTILPKGHGRLIDADEIIWESADFDTYSDYSLAFDTLDFAETIIEAERSEE